MKKLKRDLIKPEEVVVVKKTVVAPKEEYFDEIPVDWDAPLEHEVVKGDNLTKIAKKHNITLDRLAKWNGIKDPDKIKIGQVIKLYSPVEGYPDGIPTAKLIKLNGIK